MKIVGSGAQAEVANESENDTPRILYVDVDADIAVEITAQNRLIKADISIGTTFYNEAKKHKQ